MILVRVHEHEGEVTHKIEVFPAIIGRSMHCALRIGDGGVSARHAQLHATEGGYILRDLGSTNGIMSQGALVQEVVLGDLATVYFGEVRLEFITTDAPAKTHVSRLLPGITEHTGGSPLRITAALFGAGISALFIPVIDQLREHWPPEHPSELMSRGLGLWAALATASLLVSFFCKLSVKRFHFHQVLTLMALAMTATKACSVVIPTLIFNLHNVSWAPLLRHLGYACIAFCFVYGLQRYAFRIWPKRQRVLIAAGCALLATVITQVVMVQSSGDHAAMTPLGLDLHAGVGMKPNADDLLFDLALAITDSDRERIAILESAQGEELSTQP